MGDMADDLERGIELQEMYDWEDEEDCDEKDDEMFEIKGCKNIMDKYSLGRLMEIWDNNTGDHWEVGQDRDALGLVEIREYDNENKVGSRLIFERASAILIAEAILEYCKDDRNFKDKP